MLLSWSKIALDADLRASALPDDPACEQLLVGYFPPEVRQRFIAEIRAHRLRREIIATHITNSMINRCGPAMTVRIGDETGAAPHEIAYAFMAARSGFLLPSSGARLTRSTARFSEDYSSSSMRVCKSSYSSRPPACCDTNQTVASATWLRRSGPLPRSLMRIAPQITSSEQQTRSAELRSKLTADGVPVDVANSIAALDLLSQATAIADLAKDVGKPVEQVAQWRSRQPNTSGSMLSRRALARSKPMTITTDWP